MVSASGAEGATIAAEPHRNRWSLDRTELWLSVIVVAGAALRLIALGHRSFWIDEIASVSIAQKPSAAFWHFLWHDEGNMAAYYALLRPWLHFGKSEAIVRLLSVLPGVLSIPAIYQLAKRLFGTSTGLLTAALFALNPCAIAGSQEARAYSFLVLGVIVSTSRFVRLIEQPSYRFAITYGVAAGFTCYFHYFGVLLPAAHAISLMAMPKGMRPWKQYLVAAVIVILLVIPILWLIHAQDVGHISWVQPPSLVEFYHLGVFLAASGGKVAGALLLAIDLILLALFLGGVRDSWRDRSNDLQRWRYALLTSSFFSPIVIVLAVSAVRPAFYHRFLVICLPFWVMMTAVGALRVSSRAWRFSALSAVCGLSLVNTVLLYTRVIEDWRGAVNYLIAQSRPEDRVLYYQSLGAFAAENYRNWLPGGSAPRPKEVDADPPNTDWAQQIDHAPRVWLVLYRAQADEAASIQQELLKTYNVEATMLFRGVTVIEYDAKY